MSRPHLSEGLAIADCSTARNYLDRGILMVSNQLVAPKCDAGHTSLISRIGLTIYAAINTGWEQ